MMAGAPIVDDRELDVTIRVGVKTDGLYNYNERKN